MKEIEEFNDLLELVAKIGSIDHLKTIQDTASEIFDNIEKGADAEEIRVALVSFYGLGLTFGIHTMMEAFGHNLLIPILQKTTVEEVIEVIVEHKKKLKESRH